MSAEPLTLTSLLQAVVDGAPLEDGIDGELLDAEERRLLRHLRLVASVARVHRAEAEPAPRRWGNLELLECVGRGAFGEVWRARDVMLDADVALKLLHPRLGQPDITRRVLDEARALAKLRHPNVVTIHGVEAQDNDVALRMEFVRGQTLEEHLRGTGPMSAAEATVIGQDVCRALAAVHRAGLVHRDLKAQNVMREEGGRIVLMDLGSGRLQGDAGAGRGLAGTPLCLAPEVLAGGVATVRSDLYSLGVLLYHLVTNRYPVTAASLDELKAAHLAGRVTRLHDVRPDLPEPFVRTVERALAARPEDRFSSAAEVASSLSGSPVTGLPVVRWWRHQIGQPASAAGLAAAAVLLTIAAAAGMWGFRPWVRPAPVGQAAVERIAVLPFTIVSADPELEYLSSGIPMELTSSLGQIGALKVVPWSFMKGLAATSTMDDVRSRTQADAIVEGTIQRVREDSDLLRLRVQVYQAGTGALMWTQTVEQPVGSVLQVQAAVARQIAERLEVLIARREQMLLSRFQAIPADAVELYLKGRQAWENYSDDFALAITYFRKAIDIHPGFADAYAALADSYALQSAYAGTAPAAEAYPRALEAADRAIALNPDLPEAYAARGFAKAALAWDWPGADEDFRRALELDPQSPAVRTTYSNYLTMVGRHDEAIEQSRIAEERAPLSSVISRRVGWALYMARRYDEAIVQLRAVLEVEPNYGPARTLLARAYAETGQAAEAVRHIEPVAEGFEALSAQVYARVGRTDEARRLLEVATSPGAPANPSYQVAAAFAALGEIDRANSWLQRAFDDHEPGLVNIAFDPRLDPLRGNPAFEGLVARLGLTGGKT